jgi:O-antigen/teichoic acid export membrane protein
MIGKLEKLKNKIMSDSLYRNSIYLMISTAIMAVLGFAFWIVVSRLYSAEDVGLATTIISVSTLIASFSILGLNAGLIRFLGKSDRKNDKINSSFSISALIAVVISAVFLLGLKGFSPKLLFIHDNIIFSFLFIFFMVFVVLNSLLDSVFIAYRDTKYILIKNSIFSLIKIVLPLFLIIYGAYGIFSSWMLAMLLSVLFSFIVMVRKFEYKPKLVFYDSIFHKIGKYSFGNYIAGFVFSFPMMILPLLITNFSTAEYTAYYFIAFNIANALFIIPQAASNSVFAEGSYDIKSLKKQIRKSLRIISSLLIPGIFSIFIFGKFVLGIFGDAYAVHAPLLYIFAFSGIFVSINSIYGSLFRVKKKIRALVKISLIYALFMVGITYLFLRGDFVLELIGLAFLISQAFMGLMYYITYRFSK